MKKQIVIIHGGDTFATQEVYLDFLRRHPIRWERYVTGTDDWKPWLRKQLVDKYEVVLPEMPNKWNCKFDEWKIWFEKLFPFFHNDIILIGHSQGGIFLAKYLSENKFPKSIKAVILVSAPYDRDSEGYPVLSFSLPETLNLQTENIYLYHSKDDPVVPISALEQYQNFLPNAKVKIFENRQHINQPEFPELLEDIKSLG